MYVDKQQISCQAPLNINEETCNVSKTKVYDEDDNEKWCVRRRTVMLMMILKMSEDDNYDGEDEWSDYNIHEHYINTR